MPVALLMLLYYLFLGINTHLSQQIGEVEFLKVLPYLVVLITAVIGMNVMAVLTLGLLLSGIIGLCYGAFDFYGWMRAMGDGILNMGELIIITIMAGGLLNLSSIMAASTLSSTA